MNVTTSIIPRGDNNLLRITTNNFTTLTTWADITVYDLTTINKVVIYSNRLILSPGEERIVNVPLVIDSYSEKISVDFFQVNYQTLYSAVTVKLTLLNVPSPIQFI